ncbi:hypothetical protein [Streptomyces sp. NPDC046985]|uniref:hypothetical protein n=1 Tax=Streptomyces sp. NPDC046985 TaxID=3155377 RepID=UPI0033CEE20D
MPRHEFQPGRLVSGVSLMAAAAVSAGNAIGLWRTPWFALVPLVVGGLCLAGAVAVVDRLVRRRRSGRGSHGSRGESRAEHAERAQQTG